MDVSNKFLVVLLVIAILITLIGTLYSVDKLSRLGFISGTDVFGYVNITVSNQTAINVTATNCNFGTGYVTSPYSFASLYPGNGTAISGCLSDDDGKGNWTNTTAYDPDCMEIRNDGNVKIWINVSSSKDAAGMIGGNNPNVTAWSENKETDSCATGAIVNKVNFPGIEMDTSNRTMCSCLWPDMSKDEMYIGCRLTVPDNAYGTKGDVWTFWAAPSGTVPDCGSD